MELGIMIEGSYTKPKSKLSWDEIRGTLIYLFGCGLVIPSFIKYFLSSFISHRPESLTIIIFGLGAVVGIGISANLWKKRPVKITVDKDGITVSTHGGQQTRVDFKSISGVSFRQNMGEPFWMAMRFRDKRKTRDVYVPYWYPHQRELLEVFRARGIHVVKDFT